MKSTVPRSTLKATMKKMNLKSRLSANSDLLVHLSLLLFLRRLAEESRTKAFECRSLTIKEEHVKAVAKTVLKKSRG
ncbi:centromere protein W [Protopterus annectens]|uniref:centromere protein W n=1 Tax=Protopterus annectens TaxID=7888 RepID=UPI001CFBD7C2|nr:centromere protein W [Protopterus annectens]